MIIAIVKIAKVASETTWGYFLPRMSILEIVIPIRQRKMTILTDEKIVIQGSAFCRKFKFSTESDPLNDDFPRYPNGVTAAPVHGLWHFL
jgi:hypothetical protein